jgi:hypothetical protein
MDAQEPVLGDSAFIPNESILTDSTVIDTSFVNEEALFNDTTQQADTLKNRAKKRESEFKSKMEYTAEDSTSYSMLEKKAYLFGKAKVTYEDIELTAAYIDYDFNNSMVFAKGVPDSTGVLGGIPEFKQGDKQFTADSLLYNFKTKKGITYHTHTKEGDGFLQAYKTKKHDDGSFHIRKGKYTTCDAPEPHFYLALSKAIIIPNNKIVSGPANLVIEDVPLPIFIPFGFFPNKRENASGIKIPSYGENVSQGFYLKDGGYYFAVNDYFDLLLTGDIYSKGTWGISGRTNYVKRYKFQGGFSGRFYENRTGEKGLDLSKSRDFSITWNHSQSPKANPNQSFSANVNYSSSSFDKNHNYLDRQSLITNTKSSSISYNRSWKDFNLSLNLRHSQSSSTKDVSFDMPSVSFSANRIYPFRGKNTSGNYKWYQNISIGYSSQMINKLQAKEDELFTQRTLNRAQNGYQHSIPVSINFKAMKFFNITPGFSYSGVLYTTHIRKSWTDSMNYSTDKRVGYEKVDTIHKLTYAHGFSPSLSASLNPQLYGMFVFGKNSKIEAIRHVLTPTVGFSFVPDIKSMVPNYFREYRRYDNGPGTYSTVRYSVYERNIYGTPSLPVRSGSFSFGLNNNLEMKVKSAKDTVTGTKKIKLIETLSFSSSYNIYAKEYNLSPIGMHGSTTLFKDFRINFNGTINPYDIDSTGRTVNEYYFKNKGKIGRLTNAGLSFGYSIQSGKGKKSNKSSTGTGATQTEEQQQVEKHKEEYGYFNIPWSFSFDYSLNYTKPGLESNVIQSLTFRGSISLTPKWQISFTSGYDFEKKEFSYTSFNLSRNLHCWVMTVDFAPFGPYRYYNFRIAALSSILSDLKYEERKDYYDYGGSYY